MVSRYRTTSEVAYYKHMPALLHALRDLRKHTSLCAFVLLQAVMIAISESRDSEPTDTNYHITNTQTTATWTE
jgi:hypothetical protein